MIFCKCKLNMKELFECTRIYPPAQNVHHNFYTHSLRQGPAGPSSLDPATQDKMHPFYNNPMVMICATVNTVNNVM